jgi:hypothetical protein
MEVYFITTVLVVIGAVLAFDLGGLGSNSWKNYASSKSWGGKKEDGRRGMPNPSRLVGWVLLIPGMLLVTLMVASLVKHAFFR